MESNVGRCGLCQEVRALRESHLLPKALYKLSRAPSRPNPNPVLLAAGRASVTSRQIADHFLCDDCEQRFSSRGERYVLGQCARPSGEFKLREHLEQQTPIAQEQKVRLYDVGTLLGPHADEYLYFAASVFWRASARAWAEVGPRPRFSLGSVYDEQFRLYLLGKADFPRNGRLYVHIWSGPIRDNSPFGFTTLAPCTARIDGERRHKFCIPGLTFILFLGGLVPQRHDGGALNSTHGKFMWLCPFADDSLFQGFVNVVRQTPPPASLIRSLAGAHGRTPERRPTPLGVRDRMGGNERTSCPAAQREDGIVSRFWEATSTIAAATSSSMMQSARATA